MDVERLLIDNHTEMLTRMAKAAGGENVVVEVKTGKPSQEVVRFVTPVRMSDRRSRREP